MKYLIALLFAMLLCVKVTFAQSVLDSTLVQDSILNTDTISMKARESTSLMIDTLNPEKKKLELPQKQNRFVWNDRKYKADSTNTIKIKRHSPLYATLFSLAIPGLGQAYNRKYWKIPVIYAGFAGLGYAIYFTGSNFRGYRAAYRVQVDGNADTYASYKGVDDVNTLKSYRDYYKKNLDVSAICTAVWYALVLIDAAVDAHLFEWNMKDDISVSWRPTIISGATNYSQAAAGINIHLQF